MNRIWYAATTLVLAIAMAWASTSSGADEPTVKEIMTKAHKGADSLKEKLAKELKGKDIPWDDVQAQAKELVGLGKSLTKAKPTKGEQESWDKLTKTYVETVTALSEAAEKKDAKAASAALKTINASCGACHKVHKGK